MSVRPQARIERVTESYAIGTWKRLVLWVVDGHTRVDELERLRELVRDWAAQQGSAKHVALVVLHPGGTTMNADERRAVAKIVEDTRHARLASANVVLAGGIKGAVHRSILTGFSLLLPPPHPVKVAADVDTAVRFLHPYVEMVCGAVAPEHVHALCDDLLAAIGEHRQSVSAAGGGGPPAASTATSTSS